MYIQCIIIMETTIRKWGNSYGIRIPKTLMEDMNLDDGSCLQMTYKNGKLILNPIEPKIDLTFLVQGMERKDVLDQYCDDGEFGLENIDL